MMRPAAILSACLLLAPVPALQAQTSNALHSPVSAISARDAQSAIEKQSAIAKQAQARVAATAENTSRNTKNGKTAAQRRYEAELETMRRETELLNRQRTNRPSENFLRRSEIEAENPALSDEQIDALLDSEIPIGVARTGFPMDGLYFETEKARREYLRFKLRRYRAYGYDPDAQHTDRRWRQQ